MCLLIHTAIAHSAALLGTEALHEKEHIEKQLLTNKLLLVFHKILLINFSRIIVS